jgi:hypothetical protein
MAFPVVNVHRMDTNLFRAATRHRLPFVVSGMGGF